MPSDADLERALSRDAKRRARQVGLVVGVVLAALGMVMVFLGVTWVEPTERLGSRSVPAIAPIALGIAGGLVILAGVYSMLRALRRT
jgi:protein-S-isoprenylcysteine O-methyltransferase Ste14